MLRCLVLATAYLVLLFMTPSLSLSWLGLPLSSNQVASLLAILRWSLAVSVLLAANAGLNRWAENNWLWKDDKTTWNWKNEVAVVTGGSNGIGAKVVEKLLAYGIRVAVLDVQPLSEELENVGVDAVKFYRCDITSSDAVHEAGEAIRADLGPPSILINNAGIGNANNILDVPLERLRTIFDVNLLSHWYTVQEFVPDMVARKKGHIMSTASLASFVGLAGMVDYSCTKAGLIAFHEGLTQELKHRYDSPQIKTSIVYPNWTRTRLIEPLAQGLKSVKAPVLDPEHVAGAMVNQITAARSGQVILGPSLAASIRALPMWSQEFIRDRMAQVVTVHATSAVA